MAEMSRICLKLASYISHKNIKYKQCTLFPKRNDTLLHFDKINSVFSLHIGPLVGGKQLSKLGHLLAMFRSIGYQ